MMPAKRFFIFIMIAVLLLAACNGDEKKDEPAATAPPSATPQPFVTQIVTPVPTNTPLPTPTLAYDLVPLAGRWALDFDMAINGGAFVDTLRYYGAIIFEVELNGSVTGEGYFTPTLTDAECAGRVLDTGPLTFQAQGRTYEENGDVYAEVVILPDAPDQNENYALVCTEYNDIRYRREPVLWPALTAINRLIWRFPLQRGQTMTFDANLYNDTSGLLDGQFTGTVRVERY